MNEHIIKIRTGICRIVLNRYKLKFTNGNIDFKNDDNFFYLLSFIPMRPIIKIVKNIKKNITILIDINIPGVLYIRKSIEM
jgi:hypothetical protein